MAIFAFYVGRGTMQDSVIRSMTGYPESHVEFVVGGHLAAHNTCISASKRDGNQVRIKSIEWKAENWEFVQIPEDAEVIYGRLLPLNGRPYDTLGAVMSVTPFSRHHCGRWFCSELMAYGVGLVNAHRYTPGSFRRRLVRMGGQEIQLPERKEQ